MNCIGFYSEDRALFSLLSSAFSSEFLFQPEVGEVEIGRLIRDQKLQILLVDLNSRSSDLEERIECAYRLIRGGIIVMLLADAGQSSVAAALVAAGAFGSCHCPPSMPELRSMLRRAVEQASGGRLITPSANSSDLPTRQLNMVGSSELMQQVYRTIHRVAAIDASVLIGGETGTGKELVARAIHNLGPRSRGPFVAVSCGAIPETLIESELFGHEKGAFTGTVGAREGLLEQAGNGTLFLDEIGELSLYTQMKLLRVLQEREFSRLGSNRLIRLRARLIFATHRDLDEMMALGKFRQDLYFRINIVKIDTPPLRSHPEDIPELALHFLHRYSRLFRKPVEGFSPEAASLMQKYHWPGNVREIENVTQQAIIMATGTVIEADDLPVKIRDAALMRIADTLPGGSFERQLQEFRIKLAASAVKENRGNKAAAARSLNISRGYLHRLIRLAGSDSMDLHSEMLSLMDQPLEALERQ